MQELFPNDGEAIDITVEIAERCQFSFTMDTYYFPATHPPILLKKMPNSRIRMQLGVLLQRPSLRPNYLDYRLPEDGIPPRPDGAGNINGFFRWYSAAGLKVRLERIPEEDHEVYWDRLDFELDIVIRWASRPTF